MKGKNYFINTNFMAMFHLNILTDGVIGNAKL